MLLFQLMCCQEVHHSGSFYDGLRCGTADEFDLNLILTIEVLRSNLRVSLNLESKHCLTCLTVRKNFGTYFFVMTSKNVTYNLTEAIWNKLKLVTNNFNLNLILTINFFNSNLRVSSNLDRNKLLIP